MSDKKRKCSPPVERFTCSGSISVTKRKQGDTFEIAMQQMMARMQASCQNASVTPKPRSVLQTSRSTLASSEKTPNSSKVAQQSPDGIEKLYDDRLGGFKTSQRSEDRSENWPPSLVEYKKMPPEIQRQILHLSDKKSAVKSAPKSTANGSTRAERDRSPGREKRDLLGSICSPTSSIRVDLDGNESNSPATDRMKAERDRSPGREKLALLNSMGSPCSSPVLSTFNSSGTLTSRMKFDHFSLAAVSKPEGTNAENAGSDKRSVSERIEMEEFENDANRISKNNVDAKIMRRNTDDDDDNDQQRRRRTSSNETGRRREENRKPNAGNSSTDANNTSGQRRSTAPSAEARNARPTIESEISFKPTVSPNGKLARGIVVVHSKEHADADQKNKDQESKAATGQPGRKLSPIKRQTNTTNGDNRNTVARVSQKSFGCTPGTTTKGLLHREPWKPPSACQRLSTKSPSTNATGNKSDRSQHRICMQMYQRKASTSGSARPASGVVDENRFPIFEKLQRLPRISEEDTIKNTSHAVTPNFGTAFVKGKSADQLEGASESEQTPSSVPSKLSLLELRKLKEDFVH